MTRHGTLAYYLAAWVIGCFIVSLLVWVIAVASGQPLRAAMLLEIYFFALVFGAVDALLFAFLLRRIMRWGTHSLLALARGRRGRGICAGPAARRSQHRVDQLECSRERTDTHFPRRSLAAPSALRYGGLWQVPIEGAAMAAVLCLVDRAFNPAAGVSGAAPAPDATHARV